MGSIQLDTMDMPLSRLLQEAFFSKDGVTNFYQYLEKLAGFSETPLRTNAYKAVEEMSKIRHQTRVDHVRKTGLDESPTYRTSLIQMKDTEHWSFIPFSAKKEASKTYPNKYEEWMDDEQDWALKLEQLTSMQLDFPCLKKIISNIF